MAQLLVIERDFYVDQEVIIDLPYDLALASGTVQVRHLTMDTPDKPPIPSRYYLSLDTAKSSLLLLKQHTASAGAIVWFSVTLEGHCSVEQNLTHALLCGPSTLRRLCFVLRSCNQTKGPLTLVIHLEVA